MGEAEGAAHPMTQRAAVAPIPGQSGHCPWLVSGAPQTSGSSCRAVTVTGVQGGGTSSKWLQPAPCSLHKVFISHIIKQNRNIQVFFFFKGNHVGRKMGRWDKGRG